MHVHLQDLVADLAECEVAGRPALEDTNTLRRLGEVAVNVKYLELLCRRSISATLHGGDALGSASLAKSVWAETGQQLAELAFDVLGPLGRQHWTAYRLSSRSLTIAGGTTQINEGITATRVLGLPRR
jgi:alkylation response protein AidB-like acyl-CoA dehydrogenase